MCNKVLAVSAVAGTIFASQGGTIPIELQFCFLFYEGVKGKSGLELKKKKENKKVPESPKYHTFLRYCPSTKIHCYNLRARHWCPKHRKMWPDRV
jgi:hypothetical protein